MGNASGTGAGQIRRAAPLDKEIQKSYYEIIKRTFPKITYKHGFSSDTAPSTVEIGADGGK